MNPTRHLEPGRTISRYTLVEKIGEGGMGVVYKALDTRLGRHVALKVLRPELMEEPDRRRRFLREARANAAVTHPGIAVIHEIDEADGITFIVMELVQGRSLTAVLQAGPLPIAEAARIAEMTAAALERAHQARVVHRDLKPDNVILGPDGQIKLLDFGLARILDASEPAPARHASEEAPTLDASMAGRLKGTAPYMSPEQARGEPVDARSDIFSFGALLYEMLTGERPFPGRSITETLARILEADPEPPSARRPDVPRALEALVLRCLRKPAAERYEGAGAVLADLRALLAGELGGAGIEPAGSGSTIAVFPFTVRGAPEFDYLGAGMVDLLSTKLDGAGEIRSVDPHVILGGSELQPRDLADAAERARGFGAGLFVMGGVLAVGDRLNLEATLYEEMSPPRAAARAAVQGTAAQIFDMVDQLTATLLANRRGGPGTRLSRIAAMATSSFPALKAYLEGEREMRAMRRIPATEAYQRAVAQDPGFALAWYRLSVAALWSGQARLAREAAAQAVAHASRLSERDRRLMEAFDASLRGSNDEAERRFLAILGDHPDDVEAQYQLAEILFHCAGLQGRTVEHSRRAWERLLVLEPRHAGAIVHLCAVEAAAGNTERFESLLDRLLSVSPEGDAARWARIHRAFSRGRDEQREAVLAQLREAPDFQLVYAVQTIGATFGRVETALRVASLMTVRERSSDVRAIGHIKSAWLEVMLGRADQARSHLERAESLDAWRGLEARAVLSLTPAVEAPHEELEALLSKVLIAPVSEPAAGKTATWCSPHAGIETQVRAFLVGRLSAALGRHDEALRQAELLEANPGAADSGSVVGDMALGLRARVAAAEGNHGAAIDFLLQTKRQARFDMVAWSPLYGQSAERWLLAELLNAAGRGEEARRWYRCLGTSTVYDGAYAPQARARLDGLLGA